MRKFLGVTFAFSLWFFVAIDGTYSYEKEIDVLYTNLSDSYVITKSGKKIKVTFNGKGKVLIGIWASPPKAICNLSEAVPGKNVIPTRDLLMPLKDLSVTYGTNYINVEIDEKIKKLMKPLIPLKGSLEDEFSISEVEILDTLYATGPKKILQSLSRVNTESLDVKNQSTTFERRLKIYPISELVNFSKDNIAVRVIVDKSGQREFYRIGVNVLKSPGQDVKIVSPYIDTIIISGAQNRINSMKKEEMIVRIKTADLVPGEYYLTPEIILPDFLTAVYYKPQRLKVLIY